MEASELIPQADQPRDAADVPWGYTDQLENTEKRALMGLECVAACYHPRLPHSSI